MAGWKVGQARSNAPSREMFMRQHGPLEGEERPEVLGSSRSCKPRLREVLVRSEEPS